MYLSYKNVKYQRVLRLSFFVFAQCERTQVADPPTGKGGGGGEKHEIYMAAFGGHLFYDLFSVGQGSAMTPSPLPGSATGH